LGAIGSVHFRPQILRGLRCRATDAGQRYWTFDSRRYARTDPDREAETGKGEARGKARNNLRFVITSNISGSSRGRDLRRWFFGPHPRRTSQTAAEDKNIGLTKSFDQQDHIRTFSHSDGLHLVLLKFNAYSSVFVLALVISYSASVVQFRMQMFHSLHLDHDDSNPLSRLDTVFAFHTGQWAGSPVVEVVIEQTVASSEL